MLRVRRIVCVSCGCCGPGWLGCVSHDVLLDALGQGNHVRERLARGGSRGDRRTDARTNDDATEDTAADVSSRMACRLAARVVHRHFEYLSLLPLDRLTVVAAAVVACTAPAAHRMCVSSLRDG